MFDIDLTYGGDLGPSRTGDLLLASGLDLTKQRLIRRLLTNPGDYLWQPNYGAGLRRYVGSVGKQSEIIGVIKAQCAQEPGVTNVQPQVQFLADGLSVTISYTDANGDSQLLNFPVTA